MKYSVDDALNSYKSRKKKTTVEEALEYRDKYLSSKSEEMYNDILSRYNDALNTYNEYASSHSPTWGENASKTLDKQRDISINATKLRSEIEAYRKYIGSENASKMISAMDEVIKGYQNSASNAYVYSLFKNEDEYNAYSWQNQYNGYSYDAIMDEAESTTDKKKSDWLKAYAVEKPYKTVEEYDYVIEKLKKEKQTAKKTGQNKKLEEINKRIAALTSARELKSREKVLTDDMSVMKNPDFDSVSSNRNLGNPTIKEIEEYDSNRQYTYNDVTGKFIDNLGNEYTPEEYEEKYGNSGIVDKLGLYLSASEEDKELALARASNMNNIYTTFGDVYLEGSNKNWDYLEPDEISVYYYYMNKGQTDKAEKFLSDMEYQLGLRADDAQKKYLENDAGSLEKILYNVASVPANVFGGISSFADDTIRTIKGEDINPYSAAHRLSNFASNVRNQTSSDIQNGIDNDVIGTIVSNTYQAVMSGADSLLGAATIGGAYTITMGMGAASQKAKELYERGASKSQIALGALSSGAIEYITEKFSYDFIVDKIWNNATSGKDLIKAILASAWNEGIEEVNSDLLNMISESLIQGYNSSNENDVREIVVQKGITEEEARRIVAGRNAIEIFWSFYGGAISGGLMSVGQAVSKNSQQNQYYYENYTGSEKDLVNEASEIAKEKGIDSKIVNRYQKILKNNGNLKGSQIKKIVQFNESQIVSDDVKSIKESANKRLSQLGETVNKDLIASAVAKTIASKYVDDSKNSIEVKPNIESLTKEEKDALKNSKYGQRLLNELSPENIKSGEYSTAWTENIKTDRVNAESYVKSENEKTDTSKNVFEKNYSLNEEQIYKKVSYTDDTTIESSGDKISIDKNNAIKKSSDGEVYLNTDKGEVKLSDIEFGNETDALLYYGFSDMNPAIANAAIKNYDGNTPIKKYIYGMRQGINVYGKYNFQFVGSDISPDSFFADLSKNDQQFALKIGREFADTEMNEMKEKFKANRTASVRKGSGTVRFENGVKAESKMQKKGVSLAKHLASALGIDIVFFDSTNDAEHSGDNGWYNPVDNTIHIDINAGDNNNQTIAYTLGHELTHFIKQWSPEKFKVFADFLIEQYGTHGKNTQEMLEAQMAKLGTDDIDLAYEELIADACQAMLLDSNAVEKIVLLNNKDKTIVDKIKEFIKKFLDNLRNLYNGIEPDSDESKALRSMTDVAEQLYSMFEDAAVNAAMAYKSADTDTIKGSQDGFVVKNNVTGTEKLTGTMHSTKTDRTALPKMIMAFSSGSNGKLVTDIPGLRATLVDGIVKGNAVNGYTVAQIREMSMRANGYTASQINRMQEFMRSMAKFMDDAGVKYQFIGLKDVEDAKLHYRYNKDGSIKSIVLSAMVKNGDYPVNFDFSSICKKRVAMSMLINKLCKSGAIDSGTVNLSKENIFEINKALKDAGYETACLGCFVESKRYNVQEWARTFINKWNDAVLKVNPNATYFGFTDGKTDFDNITAKQAEDIDKAANEFLRKTGKERRDKAKAVYQEKSRNGATLIEKLPKSAIDKIKKSTTLDDAMKEYFLNTEPSKFTLDDVYLLIDNDIIAGRSISNKQKISKMVESGEQFQHLLRPSDLLTEKGISQLEQLPEFHGILYGHYGSGTPKLVQGFTPYNSEIALLADKKGDKTLSEYLYSIAGVRMQSFSDFQIQNIFDYLQMIADLAARKLPAHAYTKEISFAKLLGMTGIKTNLSVMFDIDTSVDDAHAGLTKYNPDIHKGEYAKIVLEDDQGKWVYNIGDYATKKAYENYDRLNGKEPVKRFIQSIGFADAVKLQTTEGYTKNCGIIGVGYSDLHVLAMLDDPRIRYVIPYHASSLPREIKIATNIEKAIDYTSTQNTMKITSITDKNGNNVKWNVKEAYKRLGSGKAVVEELNKRIKEDEWKVETKKSQNGHGTFDLYGNLSETRDPRKTADNFMSWCAKNGTLPLFYQFADHNNYYKLLYDFNVYDNVTEEYAPQQAVTNTYPTEDGAGANVVDVNFNDEFFKNTIDGYMRFQNSFNEGLDSTLDEIAGKITSNTLPGADFSIGVKKSVKNNVGSNENALSEGQKEYFVDNNDPTSNTEFRYSKRTKPDPKKTQQVYKLMRLKDGKLYPLFIDSTEPIDVGTWYDADSPNMDFLRKMPSGIFLVDTKNQSYQSFEDYLKDSGENKTKLPSKDAIEKAASNGTRWVYIEDTEKGQKRFGGETRKYWNLGINGSGAVSTFSMRPGYHAGSLPSMRQIGKGANRDLRDDTFVWTVGEVPADIDYQEEANRNPDKDIPTHIPVDGYYLKATNADKAKSQADVIGWYVAGSYKVNRIIGDVEARQIIDDWNKNHPDAQAMYDYDRESGMDFDADQMKLVPKKDVMYSKKNKSNREILAEALETTIDTSTQEGQNQAKLLEEYKGKVEELDKLQKHLSEVNAEIKNISFGKGNRDTDRLKVLNADKIKTANRINYYDKKLLGIEAQKPIKELLDRERDSLKKKYTEKGRDLANNKVIKKVESISKKAARDKLHNLIFSTESWLTHPSKNDVQCPDFLKEPYKEFLDCIDTSSKRLLKGGEATKADMKFAMSIDSLATAIEKIKDSQNPESDIEGDKPDNVVAGYLDLPESFVKELRDTADNIKKMMVEGDYVINTMTSDEIKDLYNKIRQLNKSIKEMEKMYMNARFANVQELGRKTVSDAEGLGEIKNDSKASSFLQWDNALPYYAFKRFGEGGVSIFEELMDAQDKLAFLSKQIFDFKEKNWTDKEVKEWSNDTHTIKLPSGASITLTSADAMSIYCLSRREQAIGHILGGGVRVIGIEKNGKKAQDSRANLSNEDVLAICKSLTEKQETVAKAIQEFMSTVCADWGNEIWMKRFLTNIFTEKFYFPIESNDENMVAKDPERKQSDLFRLLNISATKNLTQGANNEIIIRNIFDVFASHSSDMAKLNSFGMALLDTMKWFNYQEKTTNENGQIQVKGVRKAFNIAFGSASNKYIMQLIKDINGTSNDMREDAFSMRMIRASKTASVAANLRVAFLQMTALPRARLILSDASIAKAITRKPQIAKAEKYCGIALWKSFGFYDTNITRSVEARIKGDSTVFDKVIEKSLIGAELGDKITWGYLWNACEYEVAKEGKYSVGTDEFNEAVGKKLREVVYATQVVDSTLTKSQIMRKKSGLYQTNTAFMSEPSLSYNILLDAYTQAKQKGWKNAKKYVGRAVSAYMVTQLLAAIAEGIADALRDDDDDDLLKKIFTNTWQNAVQDVLIVGKIPVIKDIENLVLSKLGIGFFNNERMDTEYLSIISQAYDVWADIIKKGDDSSYTIYNGIYKTTKALSKITGLPISNAMREVVTLWNNTAGVYDYTLKIRTYEESDRQTGMNIYDAIVKGDTQKAEKLKKYFGSEDDYVSSLKSAIKSHYDSGDIDSDTAEKYLIEFCGMEDDKAYWQIDRWKYSKENGSSEGYSKYDDFFTAVETGKNLNAVIKVYTDNGVSNESLASQITGHFKPIYKEMSNYERASLKGYLLNAYGMLGYDREEKSKDIDKWLKE